MTKFEKFGDSERNSKRSIPWFEFCWSSNYVSGALLLCISSPGNLMESKSYFILFDLAIEASTAFAYVYCPVFTKKEGLSGSFKIIVRAMAATRTE